MSSPNNYVKRFTTLIALFVGVSVLAVIVYARRTEVDQAELYDPPQIGSLNMVGLASLLTENERVLLVDVRPKTEYAEEHIPNSISIPSYELPVGAQQLTLFSDWQIVFICAEPDCSEITSALDDLAQHGLTNLLHLEGGFMAYKNADLAVATQARLIQDDLTDLLRSIEVPELSVQELIDRESVFIIDGRTSFEFVTGFIPGAINIPLHTLGPAMDLDFIPREATILLYDRVGNRAKIGVEALLDAGYADVFNLDGGIDAWKAADQPISIPREDGSDLPDLIPVLYPES